MFNIVQQISDLYDFALNNPDDILKTVEIGEINISLANRILKETGYDLSSYLLSIDNYSILHSLKRHGINNEKDLDQKPIDKEDFLYIPLVVFEPDSIVDAGLSKGKNGIFFIKQVLNTYHILLEIRTVTSKHKAKRNRLVLQTLYIEKNRLV